MKKILEKLISLLKTEDDTIESLPENFTIYDRYLDSEKIEVNIRVIFNLPSVVKNFNLNDYPFFFRQEGSEVHVGYHKHISRKLFDDLQNHFNDFKNNKRDNTELTQRNPSQFIVGFLEDIIPKINKEISQRKYREGHLILKNISQFDIKQVFVIDKKGNATAVLWPLPLPSFEEMPENTDVIFVKDLIDAMSEYFYFNFDDCLRKLITSLENFFIYYHLQPVPASDKGKKESAFLRKIKGNIIEKHYPFKERDLCIVRNNINFIYRVRNDINFIYRVRNDIVHDKLRLSPDDKMFCKKAIGTMLYILHASSFVRDDNKAHAIFMLDGHFKMIANVVLGNHLEKFEKSKNNSNEPVLINNEDEFNESIFKSLEISEDEKVRILGRLKH